MMWVFRSHLTFQAFAEGWLGFLATNNLTVSTGNWSKTPNQSSTRITSTTLAYKIGCSATEVEADLGHPSRTYVKYLI